MTGGLADTDFNDVLALYDDCYEGEDPCRNLVSYHNWDPIHGGISSWLIRPLDAGDYILVVTTMSYSTESNPTEGSYTLVVNAPTGESTSLYKPAQEDEVRCPVVVTQCEGLLNCTDQQFNRPNPDGSCPGHGQKTYAYEQYTVTVTAAGWWSFSTCRDTALLDPLMILYQDTVDCNNIVEVNDDFCGRKSRISRPLDPGTYILVITSYVESGDYKGRGYGDYTLEVRHPSGQSFDCARPPTPPLTFPAYTWSSFAAKYDDDVQFKQNQGSIELPSGDACFTDWLAAIEALTNWNGQWIETGALLMAEQYRAAVREDLRNCVDRWCMYSTGDHGKFTIDPDYRLVPGARPLMRERRTSYYGLVSRWAADWSTDGGQTWRALQGYSVPGRGGYDYLASGLETCCTPPTVGLHDHKDNKFAYRTGSALLDWMYDVPILGSASTLVPQCTGPTCNWWKQSVP